MRNLSLSAISVTSFQNTTTHVSATAIDIDASVLYIASERQNLDADVEVEISKMASESDSEVADHSVLARVATTALPTVHSSASQVVHFRVLPETRCVVLIMRGGDIITISLDDEYHNVEVEGTVEPGILAASWSPDDSLLALVTAGDKLILMTSTFDVLSEMPLHTSDFGEATPISVGWGSKQTQFHGSLGKAAASQSLATIGSSPDDDAHPRISWRGDASSFVVSSLSPALPSSDPHHGSSANPVRRRILRVYSRLGSLLSTSEPVAGLEHCVSWRPRGDLIAGTQRFGEGGLGQGREGRHDVVFFEKNGLRHGEFGVRDAVGGQVKQGSGNGKKGWGYKVKELSWSCDSNVLGMWIERNEGDIVQLWTMGNYHWYLKQEIHAPRLAGNNQENEPGRFTSVNWHPEIALMLILATKRQVIQRTYAWDTYASASTPPNDTGCVAVLDGSSILLTTFRTQNVPPPMSSHQLPLSPLPVHHNCTTTTPIHVSFSPSSDILAVLWESGHLELWILHTRLEPGRRKVMEPVKAWTGRTVVGGRQVLVWTQGDSSKILGHVAVLGSKDGGDVLVFTNVNLDNGIAESGGDISVSMPRQSGRLVDSSDEGHTAVWQSPNGEVFEVDPQKGSASPVARFPEFCFSSKRIRENDVNSSIYIGLADSGKLYIAANFGGLTQVLSSSTTSFTVASNFVIFTTNAHEATFVPVVSLAAMLAANKDNDGKKPEWEKRRIERGSRIVAAVPSTMSLVLQMPRGNLETINPRPLVMEIVRQDLDAGSYRKAFLACRKHRIDLNFLVAHNQTMFFERLTSFVEQVDEVDYINLFLTSLGRGSQPPETITILCDALRVELEKKGVVKYVNSILTAYVVKTPPDHEAGLSLLLRLRESDPHVVEDAIKYIIFLVDADRLFDTALGMYDFSLVLMIAQHAQKDPREYLPFLRELRALDKFYQRFRIDDHLRRYEKALRNLDLAGPDRFEEAMTYVERHQLYESALLIWRGTGQYHSVLNIYGDWLYERREFKQAAAGKPLPVNIGGIRAHGSDKTVFIESERFAKAMLAHEKALQWQELFDLALREKLPADDIVSMGYRIAEDLSSKKLYLESARVLLDYSKDVREAVIALVQGNNFSEARRITTLHSAPELLTDIIYPGTLESCAQLGDDISEMRDQLQKQVNRLRELRVKKTQEPDAFYGIEDANLHNVDVMTDASMPATAFTRYTVAPTTASKSSKRSSRSKRKMERKVGSGRKGTVDEEEYLLRSIIKLVGRFNVTQSEAASILPHLCQFTMEHNAEGAALQDRLCRFEQEVKEALEEIWEEPAGTGNDILPADSWVTRSEKEKGRLVNDPMDKLTKPEVIGHDWQMKLLDMPISPGS